MWNSTPRTLTHPTLSQSIGSRRTFQKCLREERVIFLQNIIAGLRADVRAHAGDVGQLERDEAFEWHLAINTSLRPVIQQTPGAGVCWITGLLANTLRSACLHMRLRVPPSRGERIGDAEVESLWHSRVKAIVGGREREREREREKAHHVAPSGMSDAQCSHAHSRWSPWQPWRCEGSGGKWLQWSFCRRSSSFPCHGNSDRRWIYSDPCTEPILQPVKKAHSELFHLGVFVSVRGTQRVGAVEELGSEHSLMQEKPASEKKNLELWSPSVVWWNQTTPLRQCPLSRVPEVKQHSFTKAH